MTDLAFPPLEFYQQVTALKSKKKKVLLALGGWNDSAGPKYSKLVNNPTARKRYSLIIFQREIEEIG